MSERATVEWGVMLDCDKQGCQPHHADHGRIYETITERQAFSEQHLIVMGHACSLVRRTVTYSDWEVQP